MARAGEYGGGYRQGKAAHVGAGGVVGFFACLLLVWTIGGCGRWRCVEVGKFQEGAQGIVEQFNLSMSQLQALMSLLSSSEL